MEPLLVKLPSKGHVQGEVWEVPVAVVSPAASKMGQRVQPQSVRQEMLAQAVLGHYEAPFPFV